MAKSVSELMDSVRVSASNEPVDKLLARLAEQIGAQATVKAVFGEAIQRGDVTVIPVARVRWAFGGGGGTVPATLDGPPAAGSGSGAGGGATADPMGYMEIRSDGATFVPLGSPYMNPALVFATGLALAFVLRAVARLVRG
jgi:uncharacterized spore protein YtfJ